ncbi:MAG: hypothetical protein NTY88_14520 [Bacteroidetes bacterium]|nr:hypothetical protein [Bacteroidota bacterium]
MKFLTVAILFFAFTSFPGSGFEDDDKDKGTFFATVDGKMFKLRDDQLFRGLAMNKAGSMDGRSTPRTIISTTFNGSNYDLPDGKMFSESVQFEISYEPEKLGTPSLFAVALQYQSTNYYIVKEQSKLNITQFDWEVDKKHFRLSADYDCKLRSWGYPSDGKKDVSLKGRMTNIRITVPSWLTAKN